MNQQWLQTRSPCNTSPLISSFLFSLSILQTRPRSSLPPPPLALDSSSSSSGQLTARERRQLRNEKRESRTGTNNWREVVEERLLHKPKKRFASWTEELNLDNLALPGPQWWVVRVSRVNGQETAERLARALARNYPNVEFKVYLPAIHVKRKLKNGTYSVKSKPLFPGCVFLYCILNKEIHDFVKECAGIGGFLGSRVGNTKRQINRPKPVAADEMEAIFRQAKEDQENTNRAFEAEQLAEESSLKEELLNVQSISDSTVSKKSSRDAKPKRRSRKGTEQSKSSSSSSEDYKHLAPGSSVRVLSGPFMEYTGRLKELDKKAAKATVGFMLFGKESFVDLEADQIVVETA